MTMPRSHIIAAPANDPKHRLLVYEPILGCALSPMQPYYALFLLPIFALIICAIALPPQYDPAAYQPWTKRLVAKSYLIYQCISKPAAAVVTLAAAIPVVRACPSWWASYQCFGLFWSSTPFLVNCSMMCGVVFATQYSTHVMEGFFSVRKYHVEKIAEAIVAEDPLLETVRFEWLGRRGDILKDVETNVEKSLREDPLFQEDSEEVHLGLEVCCGEWREDKLKECYEKLRKMRLAFIKSADQWRRMEQPAERHNAQHFLSWRAKQCGVEDGQALALASEAVQRAALAERPRHVLIPSGGVAVERPREEADLELLVPEGSQKPTSGPYLLAMHKISVAGALTNVLAAAALVPLLPFLVTHVLPGAIVFFPFTVFCLFGFCCASCTWACRFGQLEQGRVAPVGAAVAGVVLSLWIQQTATMATFLYAGEGWGGAVHATFSDRRAADYLANLWHSGNHAVKSQCDVVAQLIAQGS